MDEVTGDRPLDLPARGRDRRIFSRAAWVNVIGNLAKILVEGAAGLLFGSVALLADAAHSLADLVASGVVLVWGSRSFADPDTTHPHGHDRLEPITALFVGALIVFLGLNLLYQSGRGIFIGTDITFSWVLLGALGFAILDMYLVYRYTQHVNVHLGSTALNALAVDCRIDILTSIAALVGVIGVFFGYPVLDPVAGGLVSTLVIFQGSKIARKNVSYLAGAAPPAKKRTEILDTLRAHPSVNGVHDFRCFYEGTNLEVEVHVEVDGELTLLEAHEIESSLASAVRGIDGVGDVHVHLDPAGIGEWKDAAE